MLIDLIIYKGKVWISATPCPVVFSSVPWSNFERILHGSFAQPYTSTCMEMWLCHDNAGKRTYLVGILDHNLCETIVPRSEFAVKTWKRYIYICDLFHLSCKSALVNINVTSTGGNLEEASGMGERLDWTVTSYCTKAYNLIIYFIIFTTFYFKGKGGHHSVPTPIPKVLSNSK